MKYVGLSWEAGLLKAATLSSTGEIESLETFSEVPEKFIKNKNIYLVTGLASDQVLRREVSLKLQKSSAILKALPFQLETLLPFDRQETVIYPILYSTAEGTDVVIFATTRSKIGHHLQSVRVDPDQISCVPLALARFLRSLFPDEPLIRWIHENTGIALDHDKVVFSQSFDDPLRLNAYLDLKFSSYLRIQEVKFSEYAIAIGLALEGLKKNSCQFKTPLFQKPKPIFIKSLMALTLLTAIFGFTRLHLQEKKLEKTIATHFSAPTVSLPEKISLWQQHLLKESQTPPLVAHVPSLSEIFAWLGQIEEPIEIVQFHYNLVKFPNSAQVELDFKAAGPSVAESLKKALQQEPTLIDTKEKITWTAHQNFYKISFSLRRNTP